jgi:hypothetical protein
VGDVWEMLRGRGESKEKDKSGMPKWADTLSYNGSISTYAHIHVGTSMS